MPSQFTSQHARVCTALLLAGTLAATTAHAQCAPKWLPSDSDALVQGGSVAASILWDPDGSGPQTQKLVIAGQMTGVLGTPVKNIALVDLDTWQVSNLGSGISSQVFALAVDADGSLIVGGAFTAAGTLPVKCIARWNGSEWSEIGEGFNSDVRTLAVLPNGDIVAGGTFGRSGTTNLARIARWDGAAWQPLGDGFNSTVNSVFVSPGGTIYAAGNFINSGASPILRIASWNGSAWAPLGSGISGTGNPKVNAVRVLSNGHVLAAGEFTDAGGTTVSNIASWDGAAWHTLGSGLSSAVSSLVEKDDGSIVATGFFRILIQSPPFQIYVPAMIWDGSTWLKTDEFDASASLSSLKLEDGSFLVAGRAIGRWNGVRFAALSAGPSFGSPVHTWTAAFTTDLHNNLIAGGYFTSAGGTRVNNIATWNGTHWSGLGAGISGSPSSGPASINALTTLPNGDIIAGGEFLEAGNAPALNIARWDGESWHSMGSGITGASVRALAVLPNGDLVAGGSFTSAGGNNTGPIARWNGAEWFSIGAGLVGSVSALAVLPNGDLVASTSYRVFVWNGAQWSQLGPDFAGGAIEALAVLPNGDIFAGGGFTSAGGNSAARIARWNGAAWSPLGSGITGLSNSAVRALLPMPDNSIIAAGYFSQAGGITAHGIARWNGTEWSALSNGVSNINAIATNAAGEIIAGSWYEEAVIRWTGTNRPWIARHPISQSAPAGATLSFSVSPATGYSGLSAVWEIETSSGSGVYQLLADGPVPGAEEAIATIAPLDPSARPGDAKLVIANASSNINARHIRAVISNVCASVISTPALVSVAAACPADLNGDALVDDADFSIFAVAYNILDCADYAMAEGCPADLNADEFVDDADFSGFVVAYNEFLCP